IESPSFVSRLPLVNQDHIAAPYGSAQTILIFGFCSLRYVLTPASVPPVPTAATNAVILPSVCFQISGPVLRYRTGSPKTSRVPLQGGARYDCNFLDPCMVFPELLLLPRRAFGASAFSLATDYSESQ